MEYRESRRRRAGKWLGLVVDDEPDPGSKIRPGEPVPWLAPPPAYLSMAPLCLAISLLFYKIGWFDTAGGAVRFALWMAGCVPLINWHQMKVARHKLAAWVSVPSLFLLGLPIVLLLKPFVDGDTAMSVGVGVGSLASLYLFAALTRVPRRAA